MYIMYVDESGDTGTVNSPTKFYILSAIVVNECNWRQYLQDAVTFRRFIKTRFGLLMKEEIHASEYITKRIKLKNAIPRNRRLEILRYCIRFLRSRSYLSIFSVRIDKATNADPFNEAWTLLIQRFENTLNHQNFPNAAFKKDCGIIVCDNTDSKKLTALMRKMRKINFIPNMGALFTGGSRNMP